MAEDDPGWLQLSLSVKGEQSGLMESALLAAGAVSVTFVDSAPSIGAGANANFEPELGNLPLWDSVKVLGLFPFDTNKDLALLMLCAHISPQAPPPWRWEVLFDQVWAEAWKEHFEPVHCGGNLWICPSWVETPHPGAVNVIIDPGMAFGTGGHATTSLCLQWLQQQPLSGATVLDYGCGSGVLAIAACLLGAEQVIAVDNDPQALQVTRSNAAVNQVGSQLVVCTPDELTVLELPGADIVLANILAGTLIELEPVLTRLTLPGGRLCLSGVLEAQYSDVAGAYKQVCYLDAPLGKDGWLCMIGTIPIT